MKIVSPAAHLLPQIFQQQVQLPGAVDHKPALDAQGIVFGQKIGVDAGHADQGLSLIHI
mgnify:CR=1 FL=1